MSIIPIIPYNSRNCVQQTLRRAFTMTALLKHGYQGGPTALVRYMFTQRDPKLRVMLCDVVWVEAVGVSVRMKAED